MDSITIGENLRRLREMKGFTQKQIGDFLNFSESFISYVEKGKREIDPKDIAKLAVFFDVDVRTIVEKGGAVQFRIDRRSNTNVETIDGDKLVRSFLDYARRNSK